MLIHHLKKRKSLSCLFNRDYFLLVKFICVLTLVLPNFLLADEAQDKGREIMQKVQQQSRIHKNQKFDIFMRIVDEKERERTRFFTSWKKYHDNHSYGLARFYKPVNLKNTGLLSILDENKATNLTDQWLYLPAFRSIKKLSSNDKNKSFMGSDFSNSDMGGRHIDADKHKFISESEKYYVVESIPKSSEDAYTKIVYKIHKKTLVPTKVRFFVKDNELIKVLSNKKIKKHKGMYIAVSAVMSNSKTSSKTYVKVREIDTATNKALSFFSTRGLKQ